MWKQLLMGPGELRAPILLSVQWRTESRHKNAGPAPHQAPLSDKGKSLEIPEALTGMSVGFSRALIIS